MSYILVGNSRYVNQRGMMNGRKKQFGASNKKKEDEFLGEPWVGYSMSSPLMDYSTRLQPNKNGQKQLLTCTTFHVL